MTHQGWPLALILTLVGLACAPGNPGTPDARPIDSGTTDAASADSAVADAAADPDAMVADAPVGPDAMVADAAAPTDADTAPPIVDSTSPAEGEAAVAIVGPIAVTFSEPMNPATLTTNVADDTCSGSFQVSADSFATCVQMVAQPATGDDTTFEVVPLAELASATEYYIRITTSAEDAAGNNLASPFMTANGFVVRFYHHIDIDGGNDFSTITDLFDASTEGAEIYISHDDANLYIGLAHSSIVEGGTGNKFVYFLFSTDPTLTTGNTRSSDDKAMFGAAGTARMSHHWKEQIDGANYTEFRIGNGTDWNTDWGLTGKVVYKVAGYVEASIAWTEFGGSAPAKLVVTTYTIDYNGYSGNGAVFNMLVGATDGSAATPVDLFSYIELDLPSSLTPNNGSHMKTF